MTDPTPGAPPPAPETPKPGQPAPEPPTERKAPPPPLIDAALWERAGWKGALLGTDIENEHPPFIGLQFQDEAAGREIFAGWRKRFGGRDHKDQLKVQIVQSADPAEGYLLKISDPVTPGGARSWRNVPPPKSTNLAEFKKAYAQHKKFTLLPATVVGNEVSFDMEMAFDKPTIGFSQTF